LVSLAAGGTAVYTATGMVFFATGALENTASVTPVGQVDIDPTNNTSTVITPVSGGGSSDIVTIFFTAEVSEVEDTAGHLNGLKPGDLLTGFYSYDVTTPDSNSLTTVGDYWHYTAPAGIVVCGNGLVFETDPTNVEFLVEIVNDHGTVSPKDNYLVLSYVNRPLPTVDVDYIAWQLDDPSAAAVASDALPAVPPDLEDWMSVFGLAIESPYWEEEPFRLRAHVIAVSMPVFADGFESGDVSAWSDALP
jgi:hypothetical protein